MALSKTPKTRIFAFPSHNTVDRNSGVDFARIVQPMSHLAKHPDFQVDIFDPHDKSKLSWLDVAKKYDFVYFNYLNDAWGFANMKVYTSNFGCKLILDVDDALWNILEDNTAYKIYCPDSEGIRNFTTICDEVDYMTTTNMYLKHVINHRTKKQPERVKVFPNYIDFDIYKHRCKFKDTHEIVLQHFGSTTHFLDLEEPEFVEGVDRIMKEYPNVKLRTVGAMMGAFKKRWGSRYENAFGHVDIRRWISDKFPVFMDDADIMVVPIKPSIYTRSKSSIKYLEMSSAGKPGVWQDIRQYREVVDGNNGFLAKTADDWYQAIKTLIDDKELRRKMGQRALKTVERSWQMKDHVQDYADWFSGI